MFFRKSDKLFKMIENNNHKKAIIMIRKIKHIDSRDDNDNTPLIAACRIGDIIIVRELLDNGADVDAVNNDHENSLIAAAKNGHLEIINYLIEHNADINIKDKIGYGVLHAAAGFGHLAVLEIIFPLCREKDFPDIFGNTPLIYAAMYGHNNIVAFLLENGANPNAQNVNGNTPLFEAAIYGHSATAKILVEYGARTDIANNENIFPHTIAYNNEFYDLFKYLSKKNSEQTDNTDNSPAENLKDGLIKTSLWLDQHIGKKTEYSVIRQTIAGEYDSRDEGKHDYQGILVKKEKEFYVYSDYLALEILIDGYPAHCSENASAITWKDYRTHGVFLEKTIKFE